MVLCIQSANAIVAMASTIRLHPVLAFTTCPTTPTKTLDTEKPKKGQSLESWL
jgi:hypothetical protein